MEIQLPKEVKEISQKVKSAGFEIYIVGGAVRDLLMGRVVDDWDFTTNATPDDLLEIFPEAKYENQFGTVMLPNELTESPFDITTYRTEKGYSDFRRPDKIEWGKSLEEDIKRRDFTINALAIDVKDESPKIVDYFGGIKDLEKKIIKAVGDPNERFAEDALRMMRAVRIASELNFKIDKDTLDAIVQNAQRLDNIARERVRDELMKILASPHPYEGVLHLKESGLLAQILPEVEKAFGVDQVSPGRHHVYDVGTHLLMSLKNAPTENPIVRLAILLHDVGKPVTYKKDENGQITFYNHEVVGGKIAKNIAERLRLSKKDKEKLYKLVRHHMFTVDESQTDKAIRRFIRRVGMENVLDMLDLRTADRLGSNARETSWRTEEFKKRLVEVQKQPFTVHDLNISGSDIMEHLNLKPGPEIGRILNSLYKEVTDNGLPNEKEILIKKLKEIDK